MKFERSMLEFHGRAASVIDEVQLQPGLFPLLRTLMDRSDAPGQFLLLGSGQIWSAAPSAQSMGVAETTIKTLPELLAHPYSGASWEGFALERLLRIARPDKACFWATQQGAGLHRYPMAEGVEAVPLWAMLPVCAD